MFDAWDILNKRLLECILFLNGQLSDRNSSTGQIVVPVCSLKTKTASSFPMQIFFKNDIIFLRTENGRQVQ